MFRLRIRIERAVLLNVNGLGTAERSVGSICHSRGCDLPTEPGIRSAERSAGCGGSATASLAQYTLTSPTFLTSSRYLSQVRQELAMRLLARVYADGNTPSKVSVIIHSLWIWVGTDNRIVVVKFYET